MEQLSSNEFRKTFARLTEPVTVTVHGHPIGTYTPIYSSIDSRATEGIRPGEPRSTGAFTSVTTSTFRPVPKPSQRGSK